jgi:type 1 glutamine amidotransferase
MRSRLWCGLLCVATALLATTVAATVTNKARGDDGARRVLVVVGPSNHPPGTHEVRAGARVMEHALEHAAKPTGIVVDISEGWPKDDTLLDGADTLVFIGDIFPPQKLPDTQTILSRLDGLMRRGKGLACVHYATGLGKDDVPPDGNHPLLGWMGGYFATRCAHHQSIARVFKEARISPAAKHPICRGWTDFTIHDEPYINNYFGPDGNRPAKNVTILATSPLPPENPKVEPVAWCVDRADGGRGFGVVMPHFYRNWKDENLRRLILNGIVWTAKSEIPEDGVRGEVPDLDQFLKASAE